MVDDLKQAALARGDKLQVIPVEFLHKVQAELALFEEREQLNRFQNWIVHDLYNFILPATEFTIRSIILCALPHPYMPKQSFLGKENSTIWQARLCPTLKGKRIPKRNIDAHELSSY